MLQQLFTWCCVSRYEVPEVLRDDLAKFESAHNWDQKKAFTFGANGKHKVTIDTAPFHLNLYEDDQLVISVNERSLLKYETQRAPKPEVPAIADEKEKLAEEVAAADAAPKPAEVGTQH